jgi:CHAD domain-containing protein
VSLEREVKLQVSPGFVLPELGGDGWSANERGTRRLVAVYHDTDDLSIVRWGASLRHRTDEGWTVKLPVSDAGPGGALVRDELVFAEDGTGGARRPPAEAVDLLRAYVRGRQLAPVARLQTVRRTVEVADGLGRPAALVTDDEVSVMQGRRVASRFREIEVELVPGGPGEVLDELVARLVGAGAHAGDNLTKLRRALGPRADAPPEVPVPELGEGATVAEVVRRALAASVVRLFRHDAGVRIGADPEDVHQARVATRRLRSDLRTFRSVLRQEWGAPLREELRWLGGDLGAVRDAEVLRDRLRGRESLLPPADRPAAEELVAGIERRREAARAHLLSSMAEPRYDALLDALVDAANAPEVLDEFSDAPATEALRSIPEGPWKHLRSAIEALAEDPRDESLHAARIRTKRVRYAAEALAPVFGRRAHAFAEAAADLQDVLGEHQDAVVAAAWLREAASGGADGFVAGQLAAIEAQAAREARAAWPAAWKALSKKRLRFWS